MIDSQSCQNFKMANNQGMTFEVRNENRNSALQHSFIVLLCGRKKCWYSKKVRGNTSVSPSDLLSQNCGIITHSNWALERVGQCS